MDNKVMGNAWLAFSIAMYACGHWIAGSVAMAEYVEKCK